jgi:ABC-type multidrug transport system fused ATPase/permease subunit
MRNRGSVAYCSDRVWIINASVRDNILMAGPGGLDWDGPVDEARYAAVVAACALEEDLLEWPRGDATIIGEKGETEVYAIYLPSICACALCYGGLCAYWKTD